MSQYDKLSSSGMNKCTTGQSGNLLDDILTLDKRQMKALRDVILSHNMWLTTFFL